MNRYPPAGTLVLLAALGASCSRSSNDSPRRGERPAAKVAAPPRPPTPPASPEAMARKARSEAVLHAAGVPVNVNLPPIETASTTTIRTTTEAVDRTLALTVVAIKGEGMPQADVLGVVKKLDAARYLSPREHAFVGDDAPTASDRTQAAWRYECLGVLLWALGFDATLAPPAQIVDAAHVVTPQRELGATGFRTKAALQSPDALLDQADLIYRYAWACVDARVNGSPAPKGVDCEVVQERHYVLNWLIGYQNQAWDDVSTDT